MLQASKTSKNYLIIHLFTTLISGKLSICEIWEQEREQKHMEKVECNDACSHLQAF